MERRFLTCVLLVMLGIVVFVYAQSYEGRVQLIDSQRSGCERGKLDRAVNATGWAAARDARLATAHDLKALAGERVSASLAAAVYQRIVTSLNARAHINCSSVFPDASLLP